MIVDDHVSIVEMVTRFLEEMSDYKVVGSATDLTEAIRVGSETKPDIVILDLILENGTSGLRLIDELRESSPETKYLIYSGRLSISSVRLALASGALGIVDKGSSLRELSSGLENALANKPYYSSTAGEYLRQLVKHKHGSKPIAELSPRERSVLTMLAEGLSSKEIAFKLGLSMHTVVNHRSNLMRKTGLNRVAQLTRYAVELGLVNQNTKFTRP